jgi:hypothetical protein
VPRSSCLYSCLHNEMLIGYTLSLAYCELYIALTALVLRVYPHMQLYKTTIDDVKYDYDLFVPMTKNGSEGVRVLMT